MIKYIKEEALVSSTQDSYQHLDSGGDVYTPALPPLSHQHLYPGSIRDPRLEMQLNREREREALYPAMRKELTPRPPRSPPPPLLPPSKASHRAMTDQCHVDWNSRRSKALAPPQPVSPAEKDFFPWEFDFRLRSRSAIGKSSEKHLEELMTWYSRSISSSLQEGFMKTKVAALLKNDINNALMFFHLYHTDIKKPIEHSCYLDKMVDLIAIYLDLEIKASRFSNDKVIQTKLTQSLYILLDHSIDHILDVLLKTKLFIKKYVDICYPIMCRVLCDPPQTPMYNFSYIRYILAFKIWKKLVKTKEEKIKINKMAVSRLQTPRDFLLRIEDIPGVFPKIPKKMKDVTLYLLQCEFDIPKSVQAFIKFARDPKNIEFDDNLLPKIMQPLFSVEESTLNGFPIDLLEIEKQFKSKNLGLEEKLLDSLLHSTIRSATVESIPNSWLHITSDLTSHSSHSSCEPPTGSHLSHNSKSSLPQKSNPSSCCSQSISIVSSSLQDRIPSVVTSSSQFGIAERRESSESSESLQFSPSKLNSDRSSQLSNTTTVHTSPVYRSNQETRISNPHESHKSRESDNVNSSKDASDPRSKLRNLSIDERQNYRFEENIRNIKDLNGHRSIHSNIYSSETLGKSAIKCKVKLEKIPPSIYSSEVNNEVSSSDNINVVEIKQEKTDSDSALSNNDSEQVKYPVSYKITTSGKEPSPEFGPWSTPIKSDKTVIFHDNNSLMRSIWNCGGVDLDFSNVESDEERTRIEKQFPPSLQTHEELPSTDSVSNLNSSSEDPFYTDICDQILMGSSCYPESLMQFSSLGFDSERQFGETMNLNGSGESSSQSGILWSFNDHKHLHRSSSPSSRPYPSQNHARTGEFIFDEQRQEAKIMRGMVPTDVSTLHAKTVVKDYEHFIDQQKYMNTYFNPKNGYRVEYGSEIPLPPPIKTEQRCGCGVCRNNYLYIVGNHQNLADYRKSQLKHAEEVRKYKNDEELQEKLENSSPSTSSDIENEKSDKCSTPETPVRIESKTNSALPLKKRFIASTWPVSKPVGYSNSPSVEGKSSLLSEKQSTNLNTSPPSYKILNYDEPSCSKTLMKTAVPLQSHHKSVSFCLPEHKYEEGAKYTDNENKMKTITIEHASSMSNSSTVIRISQKDNSPPMSKSMKNNKDSESGKDKVVKSTVDESKEGGESLSLSKSSKKKVGAGVRYSRSDDLLAAESLISFAQSPLNYGSPLKKEKMGKDGMRCKKRSAPSVSVNSVRLSQPIATTVIVNIGNNSNKKSMPPPPNKELEKTKKNHRKRKHEEDVCPKTLRSREKKPR